LRILAKRVESKSEEFLGKDQKSLQGFLGRFDRRGWLGPYSGLTSKCRSRAALQQRGSRPTRTLTLRVPKRSTTMAGTHLGSRSRRGPKLRGVTWIADLVRNRLSYGELTLRLLRLGSFFRVFALCCVCR